MSPTASATTIQCSANSAESKISTSPPKWWVFCVTIFQGCCLTFAFYSLWLLSWTLRAPQLNSSDNGKTWQVNNWDISNTIVRPSPPLSDFPCYHHDNVCGDNSLTVVKISLKFLTLKFIPNLNLNYNFILQQEWTEYQLNYPTLRSNDGVQWPFINIRSIQHWPTCYEAFTVWKPSISTNPSAKLNDKDGILSLWPKGKVYREQYATVIDSETSINASAFQREYILNIMEINDFDSDVILEWKADNPIQFPNQDRKLQQNITILGEENDSNNWKLDYKIEKCLLETNYGKDKFYGHSCLRLKLILTFPEKLQDFLNKPL